MKQMTKVCIVQHRLLHYRTELFGRLRAACAEVDVELMLVHGQATPTEASRKDTGRLPWAIEVKNRIWRVGGRDILWQPLPKAAADCELIVLMQESRLLSNYPWLFGLGPKKTRVAFWGHGRNFQSDAPEGWRERWKRRNLTAVDWWFAYTQMSGDIVAEVGYPPERITVLNNAIDNSLFSADLASVGEAEAAALRASIGAEAGAPVGLYCGSLYPDKRLELLLEACDKIVALLPAFKLVVVGDGPSRTVLEASAGNRPWLHWVGVKRGHDKAAWFRAAQLYLSPGAVGLHVLDSFVAGTPMVTTVDALHGPEIAYLQDGINGLVTPGDADCYAQAVLALLQDPARFAEIQRNAAASAEQYTLDQMVRRFLDGILACLKSPRL
ncbi:glycosyltransferase family 4 protein [Roseateles oligotrophus]|uniref:Glycosyltransferase family 4 protein n=1 Tax=Roseateles oligotrophus TaxID=1769250 RepID=A0ABT2YJC2_9BURK|nr:glycosyltransferase family 4 protein [Roseateles oligotrophus]MCV2370158.1 glycosyltransferase family 4 protein [Roseateles oligotrophus]